MSRHSHTGPVVMRARDLLATADFTHDTAQCLCGAPRDTHHGARHGGANPATGCRRYVADPAYALALRSHISLNTDHTTVIDQWQDTEYPRPVTDRPDGFNVGPSDLGRCPAQIQYRELGLPDGYDPDPCNTLAAIIGQIIHDAWQRAYTHHADQHDIPLLTEHPIYIPGLDRYGRFDAYWPVPGIVDDLKTMSDAKYEDVIENGIPKPIWQQLAAYAFAIANDAEICRRYGPPVALRVTALQRSTGRVKIVYREYDEGFAKDAIGELQGLLASLALAKKGLLALPRTGTGPTSDEICKNYCPAKSACWQIPQAKAAGRSPESWIHLRDPIDAEEAAYAASLLRDWRRIKNEAEKAIKATAPMLIGVPNGTWGEYKVTARRGNNPLYKDFYEDVQEALELGATAEQIAEITLRHSRKEWHDVKHEEPDTPNPTVRPQGDTP